MPGLFKPSLPDWVRACVHHVGLMTLDVRIVGVARKQRDKKMTPTESQMQVLRNLEEGRDFNYGMRDNIALPAMFQCMLNGWANRNAITPEGRAVMTASQSIRVEILKLYPSRSEG